MTEQVDDRGEPEHQIGRVAVAAQPADRVHSASTAPATIISSSTGSVQFDSSNGLRRWMNAGASWQVKFPSVRARWSKVALH